MKKIFIIAEAGVNHNGKFNIARELIDVAAISGADAIKFQTFDTKMVMTHSAVKANYQKKTTKDLESQFDMVKKLELPFEWHYELLDHCKRKNIMFLSTAFDKSSLDFLSDKILLDIIKIPSGEITNGPFLLDCARKNVNIILSTGMSNIPDIETALSIIAFGFMHNENSKIEPSEEEFLKAFNSQEGKNLLKERLTLLHCTSQYPAPINEVNLSAISEMRSFFNLDIGYSDHTNGIEVPIAAAALGASVIEKHFTLDRNMSGPDHKASLEPNELIDMVKSIRLVEKSTGNGKKIPAPSEIENLVIARRSLVALKEIKKGEIFTSDNLGVKRPGSGLSPMLYWQYLGKRSQNTYLADALIKNEK
jgi:N-acetylneuraminate synthase